MAGPQNPALPVTLAVRLTPGAGANAITAIDPDAEPPRRTATP